MNKKISLNNNQLKIIAMVAMFIDHIGKAFFPQVAILTIIGRISFPIFAFMIAEGCTYTKNRKKYLGMIAGMAIILQFANYTITKSLEMSVFVVFSLSIITIFSMDTLIKSKSVMHKLFMIFPLALVIFCSFIAPTLFKSLNFYIVYGFVGILFPVAIYFAPSKKAKIAVAVLMVILLAVATGYRHQWWALLSIPLLALYSGKRGKAKLKYLFYIFYPLQRIIIFVIAYIIANIK